MTTESLIFDALKGLVSDRVYPDQAPDKCAKPYIVYQQVGGIGVNFLDPTIPSKKNARMQLSVWGSSRESVVALARSVEDALRAVTTLQPTVLSAPIADYDSQTKLYGTHQDFSVWSA